MSRCHSVRKAVCAVAFMSCIGIAARATNPELAVNVALREIGGELGLEFLLTNKSDHAILLPKDNLPWLCPRSVLILGDQYRPGAWMMELPTMRIDEAPCPGGSQKIDPRHTISGIVSLPSRLEGLTDAIRTTNVVVYWYWRPQMEEGQAPGSGGYEVIRLSGGKEPSAEGDRPPPPGGRSVVRVESFASEGAAWPSLQLRVWNPGEEEVSMDFAELPWWQGATLSVRAGVANPARTLGSVVADSHPMSPRARVTLPPRGFVFGDIPILRRIAGFEQARAERDVVVFWYGEITSADGMSLGGHGGYVVFPQVRSKGAAP